MKATASRTPNTNPCFISDQPKLLTSSDSGFRKATITKGGSICQNDATTNDAKNTGCASKKSFAALGTVPSQIEPETSAQESDPLWLCPKCGGPMEVIERLTAAQLKLR